MEGCQENKSSLNLSSLILNIEYFCWQGMSELYILGRAALFLDKPIMLLYLAVL